jgi:ATP-dependent DNA helicase RecG
MADFKAGNADILVSTSVIEVGVDVPNSTIMVIEGAEHFGLAQLYQFRGRVGRGEHQSFCFLFTDSTSETTAARLNALIDAKNGFELAEKDLELRGPGQFLGDKQTGVADSAMQSLSNIQLVKAARDSAQKILIASPELGAYPLLKEKLDSLSRQVHME